MYMSKLMSMKLSSSSFFSKNIVSSFILCPYAFDISYKNYGFVVLALYTSIDSLLGTFFMLLIVSSSFYSNCWV